MFSVVFKHLYLFDKNYQNVLHTNHYIIEFNNYETQQHRNIE